MHIYIPYLTTHYCYGRRRTLRTAPSGDTNLFGDESEVTEEESIELSTSDVAPGQSFPSKNVGMKSLKDFYKKHYHPLIST